MSHNLWLIVSLSRNYTASVWHCVSWRMVGPWQLGSWKLGHDKYALQARVKSKFSKRANLRNWSRNRPKTKLIGVYSNGALISVSVKMDPRNSTKSILVIDQDGLTLPDRQYYMNAPRNDYFIIACFSKLSRTTWPSLTTVNAWGLNQVLIIESRPEDFDNNPDAVTRQYRELLQSVISLLGGKIKNEGTDSIFCRQYRVVIRHSFNLTIANPFWQRWARKIGSYRVCNYWVTTVVDTFMA